MFPFLSFILFLFLPRGEVGVDLLGNPPVNGHLLVTVHMEGEGFMCPFLTPQFIDLLETRSHWVQPQPLESRIHYAQPLDEAWSQDEVAAVLRDIGYPEDGAVFLQWDTVAVMPVKPAP